MENTRHLLMAESPSTQQKSWFGSCEAQEDDGDQAWLRPNSLPRSLSPNKCFIHYDDLSLFLIKQVSVVF